MTDESLLSRAANLIEEWANAPHYGGGSVGDYDDWRALVAELRSAEQALAYLSTGLPTGQDFSRLPPSHEILEK
jgi:hypothetical protein